MRFVPWVVVGFPILPLLGVTRSIASTLESAGVLALVLAIGYWLTKRHKWVYLSAAGIQGSNARGVKVLISWSEQVTLKPSSYAGVSGVSVQAACQTGALFLPLPIAASAEFRSKLQHLAPSDHPLQSVGKNALSQETPSK
jgi:hypothetical protein